MSELGLFTHKNEAFECAVCGKNVPPAATGCRNHCPFCLTSKHVDVNPGDRAASCGGLLVCTAYELHAKKRIMLIFKCATCGQQRRNKALLNDPFPDDYDAILRINGDARLSP